MTIPLGLAFQATCIVALGVFAGGMLCVQACSMIENLARKRRMRRTNCK